MKKFHSQTRPLSYFSLNSSNLSTSFLQLKAITSYFRFSFLFSFQQRKMGLDVQIANRFWSWHAWNFMPQWFATMECWKRVNCEVLKLIYALNFRIFKVSFVTGLEIGYKKSRTCVSTWLIHDDPFFVNQRRNEKKRQLLIKIFHHTTFGK